MERKTITFGASPHSHAYCLAMKSTGTKAQDNVESDEERAQRLAELHKAEMERMALAVDELGKTAGLVKLICGICNNAAYMLTLEAWDHIRKLDLRRRMKGGNNLKWEFKEVLRGFHNYELRLLYTNSDRFFHVADMPAETRKKYGDLTDRAYFELWTGLGGEAYQNNRDMVTCLVNKYRLLFEEKGIADPLAKAWGMAALDALMLARHGFECAMKTAKQNVTAVRGSVVERIFSAFDLSGVARLWFCAMRDLDGDAMVAAIEGKKERNIVLSLQQLEEVWLSDQAIGDAMRSTVTGYDDVWRTKGEMRKALGEVDEFVDAISENREEGGKSCVE